MHERPSWLPDSEIVAVLSAEWALRPLSVEYLPVGFGGYHWRATDAHGSRWFVTINDLPGGPGGRAAADFEAAMETAVRLASAGLGFVVAPTRAQGGRTVAWPGPRYVMTVFPYCDGIPGHWEDVLTRDERITLIGMIAALHDATAIAGPVPVRGLELAEREVLAEAVRDRGGSWRGGPYAEPARKLLDDCAGGLSRAMARFDDLASVVGGDGRGLVVTHGEPHPGNLVRAGSGLLLVDWDTVGLAPPERDLWSLLLDDSQQAARYTALTGRAISEDAIAFYRLRWTLDEISLFLAELRGIDEQTKDTELSWSEFRDGLISLAGN